MNLDRFFAKGELIPAIVVEADNSKVLMLAYMNKESLQKHWKQGILGFTAAPGRSFGTKVQPPATFKRLYELPAIVIRIPYW